MIKNQLAALAGSQTEHAASIEKLQDSSSEIRSLFEKAETSIKHKLQQQASFKPVNILDPEDPMADLLQRTVVFKLNVGGTKTFEVSQKVLTKVPHSRLAKMFANEKNVRRGSDGAVFIDRNATYFELVLDYLRSSCSLPAIKDHFLSTMLEKELAFWQVRVADHPAFAELARVC